MGRNEERGRPALFWPAYVDIFLGFSILLAVFVLSAQQEEQKKEQEAQRLQAELDIQASQAQYWQERFKAQAGQLPEDLVQVFLELVRQANVDVIVDESGDGLSLNFEENQLSFASGSSDFGRIQALHPEQLANLEEFGKALLQVFGQMTPEQRARYQIEIVGHTDAEPVGQRLRTDNWQLSFLRARAVSQFFEERSGLRLARVVEPQDLCQLEDPRSLFVKVIGAADTYARHLPDQRLSSEASRQRWRQEAAEDRRIEIRLVRNLDYFRFCVEEDTPSQPEKGESP